MKIAVKRDFYLKGKLVNGVIDVDAKLANKIIERGLADKHVPKKRSKEKVENE